jgi:hypothetical protein
LQLDGLLAQFPSAAVDLFAQQEAAAKFVNSFECARSTVRVNQARKVNVATLDLRVLVETGHSRKARGTAPG